MRPPKKQGEAPAPYLRVSWPQHVRGENWRRSTREALLPSWEKQASPMRVPPAKIPHGRSSRDGHECHRNRRGATPHLGRRKPHRPEGTTVPDGSIPGTPCQSPANALYYPVAETELRASHARPCGRWAFPAVSRTIHRYQYCPTRRRPPWNCRSFCVCPPFSPPAAGLANHLSRRIGTGTAGGRGGTAELANG